MSASTATDRSPVTRRLSSRVRQAASDADTEPLPSASPAARKRRRRSIEDDVASTLRGTTRASVLGITNAREEDERVREDIEDVEVTEDAAAVGLVDDEPSYSARDDNDDDVDVDDDDGALDEDDLEDLHLIAQSPRRDGELESLEMFDADGDGTTNAYAAANMVKTRLLREFSRRGEMLIEVERELLALRQRAKASEALAAATTAEVESLREAREARERDAERGSRALADERQAHMLALEREVSRACEAEARSKSLAVELSALKASFGKLEANVELERAETATTDAAERGETTEKIVELEDALADAEVENVKLGGEIMALNTELSIARASLEAAERRMADAEDATRRAERLVDEAERNAIVAVKEAEDAKIAMASGVGLDSSAAAQVAELRSMNKSLREELKITSSEAAEVKALRRRAEVSAIAEERWHAAEARAIRAEASIIETTAIQERLAKLEYLERDWESVTSRVSNAKSPSELAHRLVTLEKQLTMQAGDQGTLMSELAQAKTNVETANRRVGELEDKCKTAESTASDAVQALARAERQIKLLTNELDGLHRIVKSYEDESAAAAKVNTKRENDASAADKIRLRELEGELAATKATAAALEKAVATAAATAAATTAAATSELKARIEALESERDELEQRSSRGEFDARTTKVLHFKLNPVAMASANAVEKQVDELRSEAANLREAMGKLKDGSLTSANDADVALLQSKIGDLQKREQRLMTVFRRQIRVFREACHKIFGYNIEMTEGEDGNATFKLTSDYAAKPDDAFVFKFDDKASEVTLAPSAFVETPEVKRSADTFVERCGSIPAFVGNHTVEMFNHVQSK